ncbi:glycosyltransferase involved in cell wall biosynthesis [Microcella alkaliphila]|uniref:Glycosyltransferase involved in cell wall biosynthesis n=1 Tax=Microcella alkaliphila TaxID=279828 RepID=A0A4Q7TC70_9MICO|nr:glycosyltransferase [Microcella alkaliphila]RZT58045.1 glycosyltransferase involved in cell wall biosynthesis [Microcella alkaliphila]
MRIAVTTGLLRIPPTYFVTQHAERLVASGDHEARAFARASDVRDARLGIDVVSAVSEARGSWRTRALRAVAAARPQRRAIEAYEPTLVHQHFATWAHGALDAAQRLDVPFVTTVHGYDVFAADARSAAPVGRFHRSSIDRVTREATRVLAVSDFLRGRAEQAGFPADRLFRHYQGVDTDFFTPGDETDRADEPIVLFVGALEPRKGVLDLVTASIALSARGRAHRLVIVGDGSQRALVDAAAAEHDHIVVTGPLDRHGVRDLMRAAEVFALPTQRDGSWREAAGLVLLEAQACGTPAVTYDSGGAAEMVRDASTGFAVAERDTTRLGDAIDTVLTLPSDERRTWRARAREWVVSDRSLASSTAHLLDHYRAATG